ncbi:MFS transporter [Bacillus sp. AFS041924]|uniref:MFS transporter n=1 Tax=Bacillus sp. AFS041924 TaxID=2033503 RepID=UPI000BFC88C2|nr:MFS transporter [Bacillus sp. AFS041924]PGS53427.1 MFS transporter [Bacillus sp. AFS041924]
MWKNRNVWIVLFGEFGAGIGLWFGIIGNLEFMQKHVPSDFFKSLILFFGLLAGVFVGPLAGRLIDQYSKKSILLISGLGRTLSVILMFFAIQYESILFMVLFLIMLQISAAFYFPALQAVIPMIVKNEQLLTLNGIHMNISTISRIAGTSIGGILVVSTSLTNVYGLSMIAYAFLFLMTFFLRIEEPTVKPIKVEKTKKSKNEKGFTEIFSLIRKNPTILNLFILNLIPILFLGGFNLMVIEISDIQHDPSIKGLIYTSEGISFMIGAFVIKQLTTKFTNKQLLYFSTGLVAFAQLSLFFANHHWMTLISFAIFGFAVGCFFPVCSTVFQTSIDKSYHGRLFSFRSMYDRVTFQIVLLSTGLFLDTIGLRYMVLIFGTISFIILGRLLLKDKKTKAEFVNEPQNLSM